jgi:hypothetical protein
MQEVTAMQIAHLLPVMMFAATTACLSNTMIPPPIAPPSGEQPPAESVELAGFVELYADEGAQLLSGGREISLSGAVDRVVDLGGLEVVVTGRFLSPNTFQVDGVARVRPTAIAVADSRR